MKNTDVKLSDWKFLGQGENNKVYYKDDTNLKLLPDSDYSGPWALKLVLDQKNERDCPERLKRITNEIDSSRPVGIVQVETEEGLKGGLVTPFYPGSAPREDKVLAQINLQLYCSHRLVLMDGCIGNNFKNYNGEYKCVDLGMAHRRGSIISDKMREDFSCEWGSWALDAFYSKAEAMGLVDSVSMIKNLFYLEEVLIGNSEIKDTKDINNDHLLYDVVLSLSFCRKHNLKINLAFLEKLATDEEILKIVIRINKISRDLSEEKGLSKQNLQHLINNIGRNALLRKAVQTACNYMNSGRFGFFRTHGRLGKRQTINFIKTLLGSGEPTDLVIKQAMQNWILGSGMNRSSRSSFAYESGILMEAKTQGLFSRGTQQAREEAVRSMLTPLVG